MWQSKATEVRASHTTPPPTHPVFRCCWLYPHLVGGAAIDMACANAVGSNVFNIFLGIGLPMIGNEIVWGTPFIVADGMAVLVSTCMLIVITILMVRAGSATSEQRLFASLRRF